MNESLAQKATILMILGDMENSALKAANLALSGFGRIGIKNLAYAPFLEAGLIKESGKSTFEKEYLLDALSIEINNRVERGEFN